jgi:hypothetical protein
MKQMMDGVMTVGGSALVQDVYKKAKQSKKKHDSKKKAKPI